MNDKPLPRDKKLKPLSAKLRRNTTKEENHLWYDYLRSYPVQFNRQRIIGEYIADFFCSKAKLIIEIDGSQHYEEKGLEYDIVRTQYIENLGFKVLRFTNLDIKQNFEGVCIAIETEVKARTK
jgi:very-short-patch-repair endonuclease